MSGWGLNQAPQKFSLRRTLQRATLLATLAFLTSHTTPAQSAAPSPLHFQISTPKSTYHVGELIPLTLTYSSDAKNTFRFHGSADDMQTKAYRERVVVTPSTVASPSTAALHSFETPFRVPHGETIDFLNEKPIETLIVANDRVALQTPGTIELHVESDRVFADLGLNAASPAPDFDLRSNSLSITIVPATPEWQAAELAEIRSILDSTPPKAAAIDYPASPRARAIAQLSALPTDEAAREIARRFSTAPDGESDIFIHALSESTHKDAGIAELNGVIADPNYGVTYMVAWISGTLADEVSVDNTRDVAEAIEKLRTQVEGKLIDALNAKRGDAYVTTFETIESLRSTTSHPDPADIKPFLPRLIQEFPKLPPNEQQVWLSSYWRDLQDPAWIPELKSVVLNQMPSNPPTDAPDFNQVVRETAMTQLIALDPSGARQIMVDEIMNPESRYTPTSLYGLPDQTLAPAEQRQLAQLFLSASTSGAQDRYAALLDRYGDSTGWGVISSTVTHSLRLYSCETQATLVYYVARVVPDSVEPLLTNALAPPSNGGQDCRPDVFNYMSQAPRLDSIEEFAIAALNDSDPDVVIGAASYLRSRGSAAAEDPLWRRYQAWSASNVDTGNADADQSQTSQSIEQPVVGQNLAQALSTAEGWIADGKRLEQIRSLAPETNRDFIVPEAYLNAWNHPPLIVRCDTLANGSRYEVAQYVTNDLEELKAKLEQFPSGTSLVWDSAACSAQANATAAFASLASSMSLNGVSFKPAASPDDPANGTADGTPDSSEIVADRVVVVN